MSQQLATFRTEAACDIPHAREMLKLLNIKIASEETINDANMPIYQMGVFHIIMPTDMTVEDLASELAALTLKDERFSR